MSTYWSILETIKGSDLKLTKMDDEILAHLKADFPDFNPATPINEDEMKSKDGKDRWRKFMMKYEKLVDDYNFGTMMRIDPKTEYGKDETMFGMLMYCYEVWYAANIRSQFRECSFMPLKSQGKFFLWHRLSWKLPAPRRTPTLHG
jgi:hypothetical protein